MAGIFQFDEIPSWLNPARNILETGRQTNAQLPEMVSSGFRMSMAKQEQGQIMAQRALDMKRDQNMLDAYTQAKAGQVVFADKVAEIARTGRWADPSAEAGMWEVGSKYPSVMGTPAWINAFSNFDKARMGEVKRIQAENQAEALKARLQAAEDRNAIAVDRLELEKSKFEAKGATGEPIITELGGGVKLARMPGATTLHVIRPEGGTREPTLTELKGALEAVSDPLEKKRIEDQISLKAGGRPNAIPLSSDRPSTSQTAPKTILKLPPNAKASDLKIGEQYETPLGIGTWDGKVFVQ